MQKQSVILPDCHVIKVVEMQRQANPVCGDFALHLQAQSSTLGWVGWALRTARAWFDQLNPTQLGFDPLWLLACWADKEVRGCKTGTFSLAFLANELRSFSKREGNLQKIEPSFMTVVVIPPNMTTAGTLFLGISNRYRNASAIIWRSARPCQS